MKYLILGCGPAGIAAAKAARGKDKKADIVILTEEKGPPYLRPLLTDLIMGQVDLAVLWGVFRITAFERDNIMHTKDKNAREA